MGKVFVSYAREDREIVEKIYGELKNDKVDVWLDSIDLLPGQDWDYVIKEVIQDCSYFLAILSNNSISKKGYVQKELRIALDIMDEMPPNKIFLIPIRISECTPRHEKIRKLNFVDLFFDYEDGMERIKRVISPKNTEIVDNTYDLDENKSDELIKIKQVTNANLLSNNLAEVRIEHFKDFANKLLSDLVETYVDYLKYRKFPNEVISASIKLLIHGEELVDLYPQMEQIVKSGKRLITAARDPSTYLTSDREVATVLYSTENNTSYNEIINDTKAYFYCNDLRSLSQRGHYLNENPIWSKYYNAASAVPIRALIDGEFVYFGILTADSINKNDIEMFGSPESYFILEQSAAILSNYFKKINGDKASFTVKYCEKCGQPIF